MDVYLSLAAVWLLGVMSPGPDFVAILRTGLRHGRVAASWVAVGVMAGITVWIVLALLGLTALVQANPLLGTALRVAGALVLIALGVTGLWGVLRPGSAAEPAEPAGEEAAGGAAPVPAELPAVRAFRLGLLTNVANPKALVFFGALFGSLIPASTGWAGHGVVLAEMLVIGTAWFLFLAWAASRPAMVRLYRRAARWIDGAAALAFLGLGLALIG
ncbi:Threonine/homoserine/homoserine lactone efflux protein [Kytococcus aerolatus]|uniref:Threonine/homoserine/homoserine lactone efflux protein n=1 Tax=Kytococcus aerolatus TaxID=592308 RepID=A0A212U5F4_9MICO|nr:LysE family transporter [Kytococcus aerolatus]SNC73380.1 Threonine/homoserine/homoserine lactone efflux protein [Kytococcus aerolatus]